jgi:hypothetical protein
LMKNIFLKVLFLITPYYLQMIRSFHIFCPSNLEFCYFFLCSSRNLLRYKKYWPSMVANVYNPSYPGGRDQENSGLRSSWAKELARPYLKKISWPWVCLW